LYRNQNSEKNTEYIVKFAAKVDIIKEYLLSLTVGLKQMKVFDSM